MIFGSNLAIGGGSGGLEGEASYDLMVGWPFAVSPSSALVLRMGSRGEMLGNEVFYDSMLELPSMMFGWQYLSDQTLFEVGARSGLMLTGRMSAEHFENKQNEGFDFSGYLAAHRHGFHLEGELGEMNAVGPHVLPGLLGKLSLCVGGGLEFCFDGRMTHATYPNNALMDGQPPTVTVWYGGVSVGISGDQLNDP